MRRLYTASDYTLDVPSIAKDCADYSRAYSRSLTANGIPADRTAFPEMLSLYKCCAQPMPDSCLLISQLWLAPLFVIAKAQYLGLT